MRAYYFKAYDTHGQKHAGMLHASNAHLVRAELERTGLRPYFIRDFAALKLAIEAKRIRHKHILLIMAASAVSAFALGAMMIAYAGRERPPEVEEYARSGLVEGASAAITAKDPETRQFGLRMLSMWNGYSPGLVTGVEVTRPLMVIYVTKGIWRLPAAEIESLAANSVKALERRFKPSGCSLLVVEDNQTILEATCNGITETVTLKPFS